MAKSNFHQLWDAAPSAEDGGTKGQAVAPESGFEIWLHISSDS